jgi:hypoxanthine phosphoribosyltransferase
MRLLVEPFNRDIARVLIAPDILAKRVAEMGEEVTEAYRGKAPLLVGVLKGCTLFMADLIRHIKIPIEMDFMGLLSYMAARQSSGAVRIVKDLDDAIEGKDLLIVEGIVDTGMTTGYILRNLQVRQPRSLKLCTLLDKPARRIVPVPIAFRGFEIPDQFVVGYGLDFQQRYRNLPYIGVLKDEVTGLKGAHGQGPVR